MGHSSTLTFNTCPVDSRFECRLKTQKPKMHIYVRLHWLFIVIVWMRVAEADVNVALGLKVQYLTTLVPHQSVRTWAVNSVGWFRWLNLWTVLRLLIGRNVLFLEWKIYCRYYLFCWYTFYFTIATKWWWTDRDAAPCHFKVIITYLIWLIKYRNKWYNIWSGVVRAAVWAGIPRERTSSP